MTRWQRRAESRDDRLFRWHTAALEQRNPRRQTALRLPISFHPAPKKKKWHTHLFLFFFFFFFLFFFFFKTDEGYVRRRAHVRLDGRPRSLGRSTWIIEIALPTPGNTILLRPTLRSNGATMEESIWQQRKLKKKKAQEEPKTQKKRKRERDWGTGEKGGGKEREKKKGGDGEAAGAGARLHA